MRISTHPFLNSHNARENQIKLFVVQLQHIIHKHHHHSIDNTFEHLCSFSVYLYFKLSSLHKLIWKKTILAAHFSLFLFCFSALFPHRFHLNVCIYSLLSVSLIVAGFCSSHFWERKTKHTSVAMTDIDIDVNESERTTKSKDKCSFFLPVDVDVSIVDRYTQM